MPTATSTHPRASTFRFILAGLAWGIGIFGFLRLPWIETHLVLPMTQAQGRLAGATSGMPVLPVDVTLACSGADLIALCLGAILAYPARWRTRLAGAAGGVILILTINTLRIATLGRAAGSPALFDALHFYAWPIVLALAVAAYVFAWMRAADRRGDETRVRMPGSARRFVLLTLAFILIFGAASPWYLDSAWVFAVAALIARTGAFILSGAGTAAVSADNLLVTARGGFAVTQECVTTPLIPVYVAAVIAFGGTWRRTVPLLLATAPLFIALGVVRLLIVALPPALIGSPMFLIHAFYQLLTACVLVCAAALWRHGAGARAWRRAAAGLACGALALYLLGPVAASVVAAAAPVPDAQGAIALLPVFQLAFFAALWIAVFAPVGWRLFATGLAALGLSLAAIFAAMHAALFLPGVPAVRAWAIALPVALLAGMRMHERPGR